MKLRVLLAALVLVLSLVFFWPEKNPLPKQVSPPPTRKFQPLTFDQLPRDVQEASLARKAAWKLSEKKTNMPAMDAFHGWVTRYLDAPTKARGGLLAEGLELAEARRAALREIMVADPQRALQLAVPPVVRQALPLELAQRLEERLNEKAFFGVLGVLAEDGSSAKPYRRELRTKDGGVYDAHVFGSRLGQKSVPEMSVVGIAIDHVAVIDERPLRIVETGEIPNHPNNLTRTRSLKPLDAQGFSQETLVSAEPNLEREVLEVCPISKTVTAAPRLSSGMFAAIAPDQPVVEAGGEFHYLCSGGHIRAFEEEILVQEGGNGGPMQVSAPPTPNYSTGHRSHLLMRVAFPEAARAAITEAEGHTLGKEVQDWMLENSAGRMSFATTVTPVIMLPRSEAWYTARDTNGAANEVLIDARAASKLAGYDTANFDFDTVIFTGTPGSFGGQAYLGEKGCWLKSGTSVGVACHEYGHNFGLMHANFWSTTNGSAISSGTHVEYGDIFDTMGAANANEYHFNACHKNLIGWLPGPLVHDVTASGTYRIYAMDQPAQDTRLRYALKLRKDTARSYWLDLRQKFTSSPSVQNGVFLHWNPWQPSAGGTHLLDATPLSSQGKNDATLLTGRTFSDPESDLHFTPISKNTTIPPSMDVVVNIGPFPGNQAPSLAVSASTLTIPVAQNVTFTASAVDPQGDPLAYAWSFETGSNPGFVSAPTVTRQFGLPGYYRVQCVVSDMRGGTAMDSVLITVGTPTEFRVSGTVLAAGQPVANALISNGLAGSAYREARTDSDGTYTISLPSGNTTLTAQAAGHTLTPTTVGGNIFTVSADRTGVDFNATATPLVTLTALDAAATEGSDTATFRLTRTGITSNALVVRFFAARGTAVSGTDYTFSPAMTASGGYITASIPTNQNYLDIVVTPLADTAAESFENVGLEIVPTAGYVTGTAIAEVIIGDEDSALPLVSLLVNDRDATEGADPAQFTLRRAGDISAPLDVQLTFSGTATNGSDSQAIPATVTIPANADSLVVPVVALADVAVESLETFTVTIATDLAYFRIATVAAHSGSMNFHEGNPPVVSVVATDATATEGGVNSGVFTLTRTGDTTLPLRVLYGLSGTALHGTDYAVLPGEVTISAGKSVATVVINPLNDSIGEPAQTAILQLRSGTDYVVSTPGNATITITDNADLPYVSVATVAGPTLEYNGPGTFRITSAGTGSGNVTVRYTLAGTATNGTDYSNLSGTVTVPINGTATISILPIQDSLVEETETILLSLTPDPAYSLAIDSAAKMNLQDDELPQIHVSSPPSSLQEYNGANLYFYLSRSGLNSLPLTVNYTLSGTATAGSDYTTPTGSVIITPSTAGAYVSIYLKADTLVEGTETLTLTVTPTATYSTDIASATGYITDAQNSAVSSVVSFDTPSSTAGENAGTILLPVSLDAPVASPVTVRYAINGGTALGSGVDFSASSGALTFAPGETAKTIAFNVLDDSVDEADETAIVTLSFAENARIGTAKHTLTLADDDSPVPATVGLASTASSISEAGNFTHIPVALSAPQSSPVTVNYAVTGGSVTNGTDYSLTAGTLTFAPGETVQTIPHTITDDLAVEPNETIIITLSNPAGVPFSANTSHTLTITDNDAVTLTLAATDATAEEPTDPGNFTITRSGSTASAITVNLTRSGSATNGTDYQSIATTATIGVGQTQTSIAVTPIDDTTREVNETITLTLASGSYVIGSPSSATVTLVDDEPLLSITASDATADEAGDPAAFTLSRIGPITNSLSVNLTFSGTANVGNDYAAIIVPVIFPPGSASVVIPVLPQNDSTPEPSETLTATISPGFYGISGLSNATVTLTDDEPFISLAATDAQAREGVDPGSFTITRTGDLTTALDVHFTITGSATDGSDYAMISSPVTLPAHAASLVISVDTLDDAAQESYENVTLTLLPQPSYTLTSATTASVSIQDDDVNNPPVITIIAPNIPHVLLAGTSAGLMLEAAVADDGLPGSLTTNWTLVGNPVGGTVTFENTATPTTGVRFSTVGTYGLRLTATDGALTTTRDVRVTVYSTYPGSASSGDVGDFDPGSVAGSHVFDGTAVTLTASGTGIRNAATDGFYFLRQTSSHTGFDVIARISSITGGGTNARAGIMMRDGTGSSDVMAFCGLTNDGRFCFSYRATSGNGATVFHTANVAAPRYVRLSRSGPYFTAYYSADGVAWTIAHSNIQINNASSNMLVGLAATGASTTAVTAVFSEVNLPFTDNSAPVPNAGPDRTGRVATAIALSGSRTDDAKPLVPGLTTTQWLRRSGPGNITIADPGAAATTAIFDTAGTHSLRLIAHDGQVKTYDDMTVTSTQDLINILEYPGYGIPNESGENPVYLEITRSSPTATINVPVTYTGTATPGVDYEYYDNFVYLQAGEASSYGAIGTYIDSEIEGTENVTLTLLPGPSWTLGANPAVSWDILDAPVVTVSATTAIASEQGLVDGVFTVTRSGPTTAALDVPITVTGSATSGSDFATLPATVTIPIGQASVTLAVTPLADVFIEPDETVTLTANGGIIFGVTGGPATVLVRDPVSVTVVTLANASETAAQPGEFQLTRVGPLDDALAVSISLSGAAISGSDFSAISTTQIIAAGESTLSIPIVPLPDSLAEGNETLTLSILATPAYQPGAPTASNLTLSDRRVDDWRFTAFGIEANNPLIAGNNADPDHDGLQNLIEYALGLQPMTPDPAATGIVHDLVTLGNQKHLRCTITRDPLATDVLLTVQINDDLTTPSNWTTTGTLVETDQPTTLIVRDANPLGHAAKRFMRVHAAETP